VQNKFFITGLTNFFLLLPLIVPGRAAAQAAPEPARPAIEQIVREYILQHPEVIIESFRLYKEREQTSQKDQFKEAISASLSDLQRDPASPVAGAPAGVTVVEFFDYRCEYCKKAENVVEKLIADHPEIHFVFKEFPILGPDSILAAKAGLAAQKQGGYLKFHQALMTLTVPITMDAIIRVASQQGLDVARLKMDIESPDVLANLTRTHELGHKLGVRSTPVFVVGSEILSGGVDAAALEKLIAQAKPTSSSPSAH
jgi:protein-disulfide isomerase